MALVVVGIVCMREMVRSILILKLNDHNREMWVIW